MKPWELKKECGVKRDLMEWEREEEKDVNTFPRWDMLRLKGILIMCLELAYDGML